MPSLQKKLIIEDTVAITIQKNYPEPLSPFLYLEPSLPRKNILKTGISLPSLSSSRSCLACDCGLLSIVITPCICICICICSLYLLFVFVVCICICIGLTACDADCGLLSIVMTPCKRLRLWNPSRQWSWSSSRSGIRSNDDSWF